MANWFAICIPATGRRRIMSWDIGPLTCVEIVRTPWRFSLQPIDVATTMKAIYLKDILKPTLFTTLITHIFSKLSQTPDESDISMPESQIKWELELLSADTGPWRSNFGEAVKVQTKNSDMVMQQISCALECTLDLKWEGYDKTKGAATNNTRLSWKTSHQEGAIL